MSGFTIVSLDDMLACFEEEKVQTILCTFSSPINKDVERFIHDKAIVFTKQGIAKVHLVMASYQGTQQIAGYFALANKSFIVKAKSKAISKTLKRRISKFGIYDEIIKQYTVTAPLIGQLGKNLQYPQLISGDELLYLACAEVRKAQKIVGGKFVYLECENTEKLLEFYGRNGFVTFGKRKLESDEVANFKNTYLVQMLKYLRDE